MDLLSLDITWGIFLIIVGGASFYFRSPAMFVIYGTIMSWAAISNALSGTGGWIALSILQAFFAFRIFRQFFQFRSELTPSQLSTSDANRSEQPELDRAARSFPWASFIFGLVSFGGMVTVFLGIIVLVVITDSDETPSVFFFDFVLGLANNFAVIGIAAGLASILSGYKYKSISIIGMVTGVMVLLVWIGIFVLSGHTPS